MHKTRADIFTKPDGSVAYAYAKGWSQIDKGESSGYSQSEGYILTPLKKATSRNKGNELEREVAKVFSTWLYGRPDILARTPLSGGWEGSKLGDVCGNPSKLREMKLPLPRLYIEAKNREGLLSERFFNWLSSGTPAYMTELIKDTIAKAGMSFWFIVLKGNGVDPWVFTNARCDNNSWHIQFTFEGQVIYYMFPLKQLSSVYVYSKLKSDILQG